MMEVIALERPKARATADMMDRTLVTTYRDACAEAGVVNPGIVIEDFKYFLCGADLPVFDLAGVVAYMDALTAKDNPSKMGWEWRPVRAGDRVEYRFGRPSTLDNSAAQRAWMIAYEQSLIAQTTRGFFGGGGSLSPPPPPIMIREPVIVPASDYCAGSDAKLYDRTIPVHALKKIAKIEKEFGAGKVVFMITDYVTEPHVVINPDPFLMAVVPNKAIGKGIGRFVIDVWDEPGFGIAQMLNQGS